MTADGGRIAYVHTGFWPSPSPSTVFVTGTAWGLGRHTPALFIVRNGSPEATEQVFRKLSGRELPEAVSFCRLDDGTSPHQHTAFYLEAFRVLRRMAQAKTLSAVITRSIGFLPWLALFRLRFGILVHSGKVDVAAFYKEWLADLR